MVYFQFTKQFIESPMKFIEIYTVKQSRAGSYPKLQRKPCSHYKKWVHNINKIYINIKVYRALLNSIKHSSY